tara:strand:- start:3236 stop:5590 length:2355 start_codon:yes stop_codon:yes gene_type:complete
MAEDKTSKDDLTFEQALIKMLQERQGILSDIRATNRDISNDIQDQLQNSQLTAAEQKKIESITNKINDANSRLNAFQLSQLGNSVKTKDVKKAIIDADKAHAILLRQKASAESLSGKAKVAALKAIEGEIKQNQKVQGELGKQLSITKQLENNKIADSFQNVGKTLSNIPGLSVFSESFGLAGDAAKQAKKEAVMFGEGMGEASDYTKANLAKLGKDAQVVSAKGNQLFGAAAKKALEAGTAQIKGVNMTMVTAKAGLKSLAASLKAALSPLALLLMAIKSGFDFDKEVTDLQKGLGISRENALGLRQNISQMSMDLGEVSINSKDLLKAFNDLNAQFGTASTVLRDDIVVESGRLMKLTGQSAESVASFAKFANISGKNMKTVTTEARAAVVAAESERGVRLNINKVLDEAGKIGGVISAQLAGNPAKIAKAVAVAKQFGMELEKVAASGRQLLDFQSNIEAELEAELLLGRDINLEQARLAALTGDYETLIKEINKNVGDFGDFTKMNVLQQEALAKSVGMTADELSNQLLAKANLEQLAQEARDAGDEDLAKQLEARSAQEKFNDTVAQLKQIFTDLIGGPFGEFLRMIAETVGFVMEIVQGIMSVGTYFGEMLAPIGKAMDSMGAFGKVLKGVARIGIVMAAYATFTAISTALTATIVGGIAAPIIGGLAAAAVLAVGNAALSSADDAIIPGAGSGYGKRALLEEGSITLFNDRDTIIAGTQLNKADDMISAPPGGNTNQPVPTPAPIILKNEVVYDSHNSANYYNGPRSREKSETGIHS